MRAGAEALSLLAVPLNIHILRGLEQEPRALIDIQRAVGSPPRTTVRAHLCNLVDTGVVERRRPLDFPLSVEYALTPSGRELIAVAEVVESWLARAPAGAIALGDRDARSALKAFVDGWRSGVIRALAGHPLSLTELNSLIAGINYPTLERRLASMRLAGQIEACQGRGQRTPYRATAWLRQAIAAMAAAARWERQRIPAQTTPVGRLDVESAFLLAVPALRLTPEVSGTCRLAVELRDGKTEAAGVVVRVEKGRVVSCVSRLQAAADGWASGTPSAWIDAVIDNHPERLEIGGDCELIRRLRDAFAGSLRRVRERS